MSSGEMERPMRERMDVGWLSVLLWNGRGKRRMTKILVERGGGVGDGGGVVVLNLDGLVDARVRRDAGLDDMAPTHVRATGESNRHVVVTTFTFDA